MTNHNLTYHRLVRDTYCETISNHTCPPGSGLTVYMKHKVEIITHFNESMDDYTSDECSMEELYGRK